MIYAVHVHGYFHIPRFFCIIFGMMMWIFGGMLAIGLGVFVADGNSSGALEALMQGSAQAVELTLSLAGAYMLWLGLMNIAKQAGLIEKMAQKMQKPLGFLMPGAGEAAAPVALNLAANFFGLGNAATPFGIEAMKALGDGAGTATNNMCMFAALNSSAIELLPTTVIAIRAACGSADPNDIILPTFLASIVSAAAAIISCKLLERLSNNKGRKKRAVTKAC